MIPALAYNIKHWQHIFTEIAKSAAQVDYQYLFNHKEIGLRKEIAAIDG